MINKYILFDLDGTITDPKVGITESVRYALQSFGIEAACEELLPFIGPPLRDSFHDFYGLDSEQTQRAIEKYRERFSTKGVYETKIFPGMADMLKALNEAGHILGVASSKPEKFVNITLDVYGIREYFAETVGCRLDGTLETKTEVIRESFRRLSITDELLPSCIMVGDRKFDIIGAKECKIRSVGVSFGYAPPGELEAAGADYIAADVPQLFDILSN